MSCHKNRLTTRVTTLWRVHLTSLTTSVSTLCFLIDKKDILKGIKSIFSGSYDKQNLTLVVISYKGGISKWAYFCIQPSSKLFVRCIVQNVCFIVLYRTLCRKPYFLRYWQVDVGGVTIMIRGRDINTILKHCKSVLDMQILHKQTE